MAEKQKYCYDYPRPMVTVDIVVFVSFESRPHVLLIQRGKEPFKGHWALPGGFVEMDEDLPDAAARELKEETGLQGLTLRQMHTFGTPGRDPRGRTISVVYTAVAAETAQPPQAADDAAKARWFDLEMLPSDFAFDHQQIIELAIARYIEGRA